MVACNACCAVTDRDVAMLVLYCNSGHPEIPLHEVLGTGCAGLQGYGGCFVGISFAMQGCWAALPWSRMQVAVESPWGDAAWSIKLVEAAQVHTYMPRWSHAAMMHDAQATGATISAGKRSEVGCQWGLVLISQVGQLALDTHHVMQPTWKGSVCCGVWQAHCTVLFLWCPLTLRAVAGMDDVMGGLACLPDHCGGVPAAPCACDHGCLAGWGRGWVAASAQAAGPCLTPSLCSRVGQQNRPIVFSTRVSLSRFALARTGLRVFRLMDNTHIYMYIHRDCVMMGCVAKPACVHHTSVLGCVLCCEGCAVSSAWAGALLVAA